MNRTGHVVMVSLSPVSYLIPRSDSSFPYEIHCTNAQRKLFIWPQVFNE